MGKDVLISVDIGTQGTKTAAVDLSGTVIADAFEPSNLITPKPGIVEQDPQEILSSVINTIRSVAGQIENAHVLAIGVDGQMAGILGIGSDGEAVTYYDSWLDTRCEKYIGFMKREAEDLLVQTTGAPPSYTHGPKVLWWKHEQPETYKKIAKFVVPSAYVVGRLVGLSADQAYEDYTYLHFSGFADAEKTQWSRTLLDIFKVKHDKMPTIVKPWQVVGGLTETMASLCGLSTGTPVVAGCGDSAATSLGAGITQPGQLFDVAGTASIFSCCVDKYAPDVATKTLLYARSVVPGLWIPMAYINGGGMCLKWFRDNLSGERDYGRLDLEADQIAPGSGDLTFLPHFSGRVSPNDPYIRGTWIGLTWSHTRGHLYRSIMEGIGYEYKLYFDIIQQLMGEYEFSDVRVIGGGANSRVFNSIKSDILGRKYAALSVKDAANLGSAIVAGYGVGVFDDFQETLGKIITVQDEVEPNLDNHRAYVKQVRHYDKCLESIGHLLAQSRSGLNQ